LSHDNTHRGKQRAGDGLRRADLDPDPWREFEKRFTLAAESGIPEPNAICLAWIIQMKIQWINCGGNQLPIVSRWGLNKGARYSPKAPTVGTLQTLPGIEAPSMGVRVRRLVFNCMLA